VSAPLIRHLLGRILRGPRLLGLVALASVPGAVAWLTMAGQTTSGAVRSYQEVSATLPAATLSIAVLFAATAVLRDERDGGTLPFLFISPVGRVRFSGSAWAAGAVAAVLIATAGWSVGAVALVAVSGTFGPAVPVLVLYVSSALAYSALFVPLGYLFGRSLVPGLAYVFVWEGILATVVPGLSASSVWRIAMSIYADIEDGLPRDALDVLGTVEPGVWGGAITVAGLVLAGVGVLTWAVRFRDAV
jgi:ABC-type transport system involved in multi-copper enzyme maturation permease subunit